MPILVDQDTDIDKLVDGIYNNQVVPIFKISNVTGEGFDKMKDFLPKLKSRVSSSGQFKSASEPVEFMIDGDY